MSEKRTIRFTRVATFYSYSPQKGASKRQRKLKDGEDIASLPRPAGLYLIVVRWQVLEEPQGLPDGTSVEVRLGQKETRLWFQGEILLAAKAKEQLKGHDKHQKTINRALNMGIQRLYYLREADWLHAFRSTDQHATLPIPAVAGEKIA